MKQHRSARAAFAAAAAATLAGCTFLIDFEEVPPPADASGVDSSVLPGAPDVRVDGPLPVDAGRDAEAAARDAIADPTACKTKPDGKYCAGNQIDWDGGNNDDLITCKAALVSAVRLCSQGTGCIAMLEGFPDECDECAKKTDGTYCGRDMPGWDAKNANQRVRCQNGRLVGLLLCANTCKSMGAASLCP